MFAVLSCLVIVAVLALAASPAVAEQAAAKPLGELKRRIELARDRMLDGRVPEFTEDFILADVALRPDYPRRFANYSGDLSGRVIGALADHAKPFLDGLVVRLLEYQKPDGRFGSTDLRYLPDEIGLDHMALLWGNGRLLVGLLEYHAVDPDEAVLAASRRLGDFLLSVHDGCADARVADNVKDLGAAGMVCFSQLNEGLVLLAQATGDRRYLDGAAKTQAWLPNERGKQHSHGYLTTLRGMVMLHEATGDAAHLQLAEKLYNDLVHSADCQVYGGVQEYFGGKGDRDEGCSEADFLRLSLQLWRVTGNIEHLERAERCLVNQFYANQFLNGDFGHQLYFDRGIAPHSGVGRAWWCCTMHGLRAFRDVLDAAITVDGDGTVRVNLFQDVAWSDGTRGVVLERSAGADGAQYTVTATQTPADGTALAIRRPAWAKAVAIASNGAPCPAADASGYLVLERRLRQGERVDVRFTLDTRLVKRDGTVLDLGALTDRPVEAALFHGPWLLGVDGAFDPLFFGEPWTANEVLLPAEPGGSGDADDPLVVPAAHLCCEYTHDGFPGSHPLTLRPMSERCIHAPATFAAWLNYRLGR